ncbi:WxL domain-containing protein [Carnobacterium sp.]|uniref:WxL domain-containing protein n=1 Tax=Carnobacterium sp. TaxID=48221 RepID=UPI0028AEF679|nr:WxL domain-containing protein [Carnobacterium sp.]
MKNKKLVSLALIGLFFIGGLSQSVTAAESEATVNFIPAGEDSPAVLDPTTPETSYTPGPGDPDGVTTGEAGPLTLDFVSNIEFDDHEISAVSEVYNSITLRPFIQVTDRRGTGGGWTVTATASSFTTGTTPTPSLQGSTITLSNASLISNNTTTAPSTLNDSIVLETDGATSAIVVEAAQDEGLGSWITRWFDPAETAATENSNVTLTVPGGVATQGTHTATITWLLEAAP